MEPFPESATLGWIIGLVRRDLLTPDEIVRLLAGAMLLLRQGAAPILAGKVSYFADPEFRGLFDQPNASGLRNAA